MPVGCLRHTAIDDAFTASSRSIAPVLEALGQQAMSIAGRPEQFDDDTAPAPKHEHVSAERIIGQRRINLRGEPIETGTYDGDPRRDPDAWAGRRPIRCADLR